MTDNTKMREAFEKWAVSEGMPITRGHYYDDYADGDAEIAWRAWQAARTVPDEAVSILADVIRELENGFVRCETCGDQEDTATLDCIDELRRVHYMLSAAPEPKK